MDVYSLVVVFVLWINNVECRLSCLNLLNETDPDFFLVAPCSVSNMRVIARSNLSKLKECKRFAKKKRGLAISFSKYGNGADSCLVHDCPEYDVLTSIVRDPDYDYYSLYANPLPSENTTCVAGIGVFHLHFVNQTNYTEAVEKCRSEGAELANVISEVRTGGLSAVVGGIKGPGRGLRRAYVGMDDLDEEGKFITTTGKILDCYLYRAWSPGEPRHSKQTEDCVVLDNRFTWRVVDCSKKLPYLCEMLPSGPFPIRDNKDRCRVNLTNRKPPEIPDYKSLQKESVFLTWIG